MTMYNVHYVKTEHFGKFMFGGADKIDVAKLDSTHTLLKEVSVAADVKNPLEAIFALMQAENWSPNGEARSLIEEKGLAHTSMSVGDVVEEVDTGKLYMVETMGFKELAR